MASYPYPLSVAPMMQVTDRYWRRFARELTRETLLYTEMVVDNALLHGADTALGSEPEDDPVAVQLGGNDPESLAKATEIALATLGERCVEVNLNCGCPSPTVAKKNCFGARLMLHPDLVRRLVKEMQRRSRVPVSVKHRLGTDEGGAEYDVTAKFVKAASEGGARHFIVHTRMAVLSGLSAEKNRSVPPLHPEVAHRLVTDFPDLTFSINGGLKNLDDCSKHLSDGVHSAMVGRAAWYTPFDVLGTADTRLFGKSRDPASCRRQVLLNYGDYLDSLGWSDDDDVPIYRPLYYAFTGFPNAKKFRIVLVKAQQERRAFHRRRSRGFVVSTMEPSLVISDALQTARVSDTVLDQGLDGGLGESSFISS